MIDDFTLARALHVLAIVHWIGGVSMVTLVLLPALRQGFAAEMRLPVFERLEHRFAAQARISTLLAGASGFWMVWRLDGWSRFVEPSMWWMAAMLGLWLLFSLMLFVAEPLFLHRWFREKAARNPEATFRTIARLHAALLGASLLTTAAAVLGAHGAI